LAQNDGLGGPGFRRPSRTSPISRSIGHSVNAITADQKLKRIEINGTIPEIICPMPNGVADVEGAWGADGALARRFTSCSRIRGRHTGALLDTIYQAHHSLLTNYASTVNAGHCDFLEDGS
jgi:hypothetical protein